MGCVMADGVRRVARGSGRARRAGLSRRSFSFSARRAPSPPVPPVDDAITGADGVVLTGADGVILSGEPR